MATVLPGRHPGADRGGPVDPAALRRVLVVRADNLGDVVTAGPVAQALRAVAPHVVLDLLASPAGAQVAPLLPGLDGVLEVSPSWQQLDACGDHTAGERALLARVERGRYDAMIVLTSPTQSPWPAAHLGLLAGVGIRVVHSREFGGAVATHWVTPPAPDTHQVDRGLHLLAAVGLAPPEPVRTPSLRVDRVAAAEAGAALRGARGGAGGDPRAGRFALLVPGASAASRRYPAARFAAVARAVADAGLQVRIAGSVAESALVADVAAGAGHPQVTALPPTSVPAFAALLARAAVAITNNSGGMHLADAVGTPVVVTWAGTDPPAGIAPRSVPATLLGRPVPCSPCRLLTCPFDHGCLDVPPAEVAAAALALVPDHQEVACPR